MDTERFETVTLADGRRIAYGEYGDAAADDVVFYLHGTPGTRLEARRFNEAGRRQRVRVIGVDRPGYGQSDFKPNRRLREFPDDLAALADHVGAERFGVIGLSGGSPHAEAVAVAMPERVVSLAVVSGAGPPESREALGRFRRLMYRAGAALAPLWAWLVAWWLTFWSTRLRPSFVPRSIDRRVMSRPEMREGAINDLRESLRQGGRAMAQDLGLLAKPWGFDPRDIRVPTHLWHGDADTVVRIEHGRWVADRIPGCDTHILRDEGHLLFVDHADEIIAAMKRDFWSAHSR